MLQSYREFWQHLFTWNATATRRQYCWPIIINTLISMFASGTLESLLGHNIESIYNVTDLSTNLLAKLIMLAVYVANLTLMARRLHDLDQPAWWLLVEFVPFLGNILYNILLLVLLFAPTRLNSRWSVNQTYA